MNKPVWKMTRTEIVDELGPVLAGVIVYRDDYHLKRIALMFKRLDKINAWMKVHGYERRRRRTVKSEPPADPVLI